MGDLEHEPGVDEAVAFDEAVLLLALAGGSETVVLAGRGLADPAGDTQTPDIVERARQALHAAVSFFVGCMATTFALSTVYLNLSGVDTIAVGDTLKLTAAGTLVSSTRYMTWRSTVPGVATSGSESAL